MLNRLKDLFNRGQAAPRPDNHERLAAAALMVEAAAVDGNIADSEWDHIRVLLEDRFALSTEEVSDLMEQASHIQAQSNQLFKFTHDLKDQYPPEDRVMILELLWEVVLADGVLGPHEDALIRRIAGLLYVSDRERGDAKKRALTKLGLSA